MSASKEIAAMHARLDEIEAEYSGRDDFANLIRIGRAQLRNTFGPEGLHPDLAEAMRENAEELAARMREPTATHSEPA